MWVTGPPPRPAGPSPAGSPPSRPAGEPRAETRTWENGAGSPAKGPFRASEGPPGLATPADGVESSDPPLGRPPPPRARGIAGGIPGIPSLVEFPFPANHRDPAPRDLSRGLLRSEQPAD